MMYQYDEKNICDEKNNYPFILLEEETFDILYFCIVVNFFSHVAVFTRKEENCWRIWRTPRFSFYTLNKAIK